MKTAMKVLTALAAAVGIVYVIATYGDKIVEWAKKTLASCPCCKNSCEVVEEDFVSEEPAEEAAVETADAEPEIEVEIVVDANEPVADEADFEA